MRPIIIGLCVVALVCVSCFAFLESLSRAQLQARYAASERIRKKDFEELARFHSEYLSARGISHEDYLNAVEQFCLTHSSLVQYLEACRSAVLAKGDTSGFGAGRPKEPK